MHTHVHTVASKRTQFWETCAGAVECEGQQLLIISGVVRYIKLYQQKINSEEKFMCIRNQIGQYVKHGDQKSQGCSMQEQFALASTGQLRRSMKMTTK